MNTIALKRPGSVNEAIDKVMPPSRDSWRTVALFLIACHDDALRRDPELVDRGR
jgi:hypothetical protein